MSGLDAYVKLMLHMDDVGLSDSSSSGHTVTLNGNAARSASQSKFGGYSGYVDGTGDYLIIPHSTDWDFGTGDFTIDLWVYLNTYGSYVGIISTDGPGEVNNGVVIATNSINLYCYVGNTLLATGTYSINTWNHVALVSESGTQTFYINGVSKGSKSLGSMPYPGNGLVIGRTYTGLNAYYINGYVDELRISKGIARWTSNFTPPTEAYSSGPTVTLADPFTITCSLSGAPSTDTLVTLTEAFTITCSLSGTTAIGIPLPSSFDVQISLGTTTFGAVIFPDPLNVTVSMSIGDIVSIYRELLDRDSLVSTTYEENSPITILAKSCSLINEVTTVFAENSHITALLERWSRISGELLDIYDFVRKTLVGKYDIPYPPISISNDYDILLKKMLSGKYDGYLKTSISGEYGIFLNKMIEGVSDIHLQKTLEGDYGINLQKAIEGVSDIYLQKTIEAGHDILLQKTIDGVSDIHLQKTVEGVNDIYLQKTIEGEYGISVERTLENIYDIYLQKSIEGEYGINLQKTLNALYDIYLQKSTEGVYDILGDQWGNSDAWGDSDIWGAWAA